MHNEQFSSEDAQTSLLVKGFYQMLAKDKDVSLNSDGTLSKILDDESIKTYHMPEHSSTIQVAGVDIPLFKMDIHHDDGSQDHHRTYLAVCRKSLAKDLQSGFTHDKWVFSVCENNDLILKCKVTDEHLNMDQTQAA